MVEQVKSKIKEAFEKFSINDKIDMKDIRVKIEKKDFSTNLTLMNKNVDVRKTKLAEIVGNSMLAVMVKPRFEKAVETVLNENNAPSEFSSVKFFVNQQNEVSAYLFVNGKAQKEIEIEKLIN